jgi:hypothetical protein
MDISPFEIHKYFLANFSEKNKNFIHPSDACLQKLGNIQFF